MKKSPLRFLGLVITLPLFLGSGCAWQSDLEALQKEVSSLRGNVDKVSADATLGNKRAMDTATSALKNAEVAANAAQKAGVAAEAANIRLARILEKPKVYTLNFGFNKSQVNYAMRRSIEQISRDWKGKATGFRIEGHADLVGSQSANLKLSQKRANRVKDALVQSGISPSIIDAVGVGHKKLAVQTKRGKQLRFNRRVVLIVEPKKS
jgi:outer membrane protein OmpA-like peptidoglycan-associated protein